MPHLEPVWWHGKRINCRTSKYWHSSSDCNHPLKEESKWQQPVTLNSSLKHVFSYKYMPSVTNTCHVFSFPLHFECHKSVWAADKSSVFLLLDLSQCFTNFLGCHTLTSWQHPPCSSTSTCLLCLGENLPRPQNLNSPGLFCPVGGPATLGTESLIYRNHLLLVTSSRNVYVAGDYSLPQLIQNIRMRNILLDMVLKLVKHPNNIASVNQQWVLYEKFVPPVFLFYISFWKQVYTFKICFISTLKSVIDLALMFHILTVHSF